MKFRYLILLVLFIACCSVTEDNIVSHRMNGLSLQDSWGQASSVDISDNRISDNIVHLSSLWDEDSLYFRFDVEDSNLWATQTNHDDTLLYLDDMCEILLDPRNDKGKEWLEDDIIYHVNLLGTIKDDRGEKDGGQDVAWNGRARTTVFLRGTLNNNSDIDDGYVVEIAVPWSEIAVVPSCYLKIGFNFGNSDRDGEERTKKMIFFRVFNPTRTPSSFATLRLEL